MIVEKGTDISGCYNDKGSLELPKCYINLLYY